MGYASLANAVRSLIAREGTTCTVRRKSWDTGMHNPVTDEPGSSEVREYRGISILVLPASVKTANQFSVQGLVREKIRDFFLAGKGLTFTPVEGDEIDVMGRTWTILSLGVYEPDETPLLYSGVLKL